MGVRLKVERVPIKGSNWVVGFVMQCSKDESIMVGHGVGQYKNGQLRSCGPLSRLAPFLEFR